MTDHAASACPACGAPGPHPLHLRTHRDGTDWMLLRCGVCEARFYDPMPLTEDIPIAASPDILRWYLEQNVNLWFYAAQLGPVLVARQQAGRPPGVMLDIGCGFGFPLDVARRAFGWQVRGVEPSSYGALGAEALDLPILQGLLTEQDLFDGQKFDLICASQVIEHIPAPGAFLELLRRYLAPGGVIALTTPCADAIDEPALDTGMRDALLSPGSHTVLFNPPAMRALLAAHGFAHTEVSTGRSQVTAYASEAPLALAEIDADAVLIDYLNRAVAELPDGMIRQALRGRLYCSLVERADFAQAERVWPDLAFPPPGSLAGIAIFEQFLTKYPANAAALAYRRGMQLLNGGGNAAEAAAMFAWSAEICRWRLAIPGAECSEEGGLLWPARFHEAFAWLVAGQAGKAAALGSAVLAEAGAALDPALRARAEALLADLPATSLLGRVKGRVTARLRGSR